MARAGVFTHHDHQRNLVLNSFHEIFWGFGIAFHSTEAVIPLFLKELGAPLIVIGSVAGVFTICAAVLQIFSAFYGGRVRNIKAAVIAVNGLLVPPIFLAGFIFAFISPTGSSAWLFYYINYVLFALSLGIVFPIWADFLGTVHLREKRGTFFGVSFAFNSAAGIFGGLAVKKLLSSSVPFPANFGYGFLIYTGCIIAATILFLFYRTQPRPVHSRDRTFGQFLTKVRSILARNKNFRRYIISRMLLTANYPAISLYAVYSQSKLNFDISEAGIFAAITVLLAALSSYATGKMGDRFGHKNAMVLIFTAYLLALVSALTATTMAQTYLIFIFLGLGKGGFLTSAMSLVYEFAGQEDKKIYFALIDSLTAPFVLLFIVLVGLLIPIFGIPIVLVGIGLIVVLGILSLMLLTKEPGAVRSELPPPETVL
ncbi:MAG: MFS transporter [Fidelibacterota bacterium]